MPSAPFAADAAGLPDAGEHLPDGGTRTDPRLSRIRRRAGLSTVVAVAILVAVLASGCDASLDRAALPQTAPGSATGTPSTTVSITPVTPDGLITGPGVTDQTITLGLLVDPDRDRGFSDGVRLWQDSVNSAGGLCGRTLDLVGTGTADVPSDPVQAYDQIGRSVLGLITLPPEQESVALNSSISADQIPAMTPTGTSAQLGPGRPVVIGPTDDVLAINALDYLDQTDRIGEGATVGVLTDGSPEADNALAGARWWAGEHQVSLEVRAAEADTDLTSWGAATTVLALTDAATTARLATALPAQYSIVTTLDGYDPAAWDADARAVAAAGRVLVGTGTPAYGSDYPAAVVVASLAAARGVPPGPRLFDGFATGITWARLLDQVCTDRTLTRQAVQQAFTTVGAASGDSLFGPSDPALPVESALPATLLSAMSTANPAAPADLTPLTSLDSAAGIEDYLP